VRLWPRLAGSGVNHRVEPCEVTPVLPDWLKLVAKVVSRVLALLPTRPSLGLEVLGAETLDELERVVRRLVQRHGFSRGSFGAVARVVGSLANGSDHSSLDVEERPGQLDASPCSKDLCRRVDANGRSRRPNGCKGRREVGQGIGGRILVPHLSTPPEQFLDLAQRVLGVPAAT
jgi:hypothetical protein